MAGIEDSMLSFLSALPQMLLAVELSVYAIAIFFYGGIAVRGLRHRQAWIRWPLLALSGILCLSASFSFAYLFPIPKGLELLKLDAFMAGMFSAILFALSLSLMTHDAKVYTLPYLAERLEKLKAAALSRKGLRPIERETAEQIAFEKTKWNAAETKLAEGKWYVKMKDGESARIVEIDALDGTVEKVYYHPSSKIMDFLLDWKKTSGLAISLLLAVSIIITFKGFPSMATDLESLGLNKDLINQLKERSQANADPGCREAMKEAPTKTINSFPEVKDNRTRQAFQKLVEGRIKSIHRLQQSNGTAALTEEGKACIFSRDSRLCACLDVAYKNQ